MEAAESIVQNGCRVWFEDDNGRYARGGNLGAGVYITCNWRIALWFGSTLLRVVIRPGTRFLNTALPPDGKIVDYLQREFGREILRKPPLMVLPKNKKLRLRELISLFRYHYWHTWEKEKDYIDRGWTRQRKLHCRLLTDFRSLLTRYGLHGYGNSEDDNSIVFFAEDRLILKEVVAEIGNEASSQLQSIGEVKEFFRCHASLRAKKLRDFRRSMKGIIANTGLSKRDEAPAAIRISIKL